jgi:hypothetical protein
VAVEQVEEAADQAGKSSRSIMGQSLVQSLSSLTVVPLAAVGMAAGLLTWTVAQTCMMATQETLEITGLTGLTQILLIEREHG